MAKAVSECTTQTDEVATMMEKLGLTKDDRDVVVFEEEEKQPEAATRWMAVAKVHTETEFSHFWFFKNMRSAWDLAKDVKIRVIEDNLFSLQFSCLGDWEKVMDGGPWVFRGRVY
jgi:3-hydroxyisobutyrate dehydrogenase-like beta-hydroxyacid dehydrogenase